MSRGLFWDADGKFQQLPARQQGQVRKALSAVAEALHHAQGCVYLSQDLVLQGEGAVLACQKAHPNEVTVCSAGEANVPKEAAQAIWPAVLWAYADKIVVGESWAQNGRSVEEVVQGVMIGAGMRDRSTDLELLKIANAAAAEGVEMPLTLDAIVEQLGGAYQNLRKAGNPATVQATALARLLHLHDMISERRPDPYFGRIPGLNYDAQRMKALSRQLKPRLATESIDDVDQKDLQEFFGELSFEPEEDSFEFAMAM